MKQQIDQVKAMGFRPVLFIDNDLTRKGNEELAALIEGAEELQVPVIFSSNVEALNKIYKAYVFRYGHIAGYNETMVLKKGGRVVSGDLKIPAAH